MTEIFPPTLETIRNSGIVPVLTVNDAKTAVGAARALQQGGIAVVEVTFRTEAAAAAIAAIRGALPGVTVGAGTILDTASLEEAIAAGAQFGAAPGYDPDIVNDARLRLFPFFPGVCTPTDIGRAIVEGHTYLKFFPAENFGGAKTLAAIIAPFAHLRPLVMPTGSITAEKAPDYLKLPYVLATGASWVCPPALVSAGNWDEIRRLASTAAEIVARARRAE